MLIHKSALACHAVCSDDAARLPLNNVHVAPDGTATATDGRVLLRVKPPVPDEAEYPQLAPGFVPVEIPAGGFLLPASVARDALKALKTLKPHYGLARLGQCVQVEELNGNVTLGATDLDKRARVTGRVPEEKFPDVEQIIPRGAPAFAIAFDPCMLADLLKAVIEAAGFRHGDVGDGVRFEFREPLGPATLTATGDNGAQVFALAMPMRLPDRPTVTP